MISLDIDSNLPSPLEKVRPFWDKNSSISLWVKRDDILHPYISGNKWRKLSGWIDSVTDPTKIWASVGGGYSNHLLALAYWGCKNQKTTRGYIGVNPEEYVTPTTWLCHKWGMELIPTGRKNAPTQGKLEENWMPMGGGGVPGTAGTCAMIDEVPWQPDVLITSVGTATTLMGMALGVAEKGWLDTQIIAIPALKGASYLEPIVENFLGEQLEPKTSKSIFGKIEWWNEEHLGGFGKISPDLIRFINQFYKETGIPLDPIYTGKSMWALSKKWHKFPKNSSVVFWHTGGLLGGMGVQKALKSQSLDYLSNLFPISFPDNFPTYLQLTTSGKG